MGTAISAIGNMAGPSGSATSASVVQGVSVTYTDSNGKSYTKTGGYLAWRNNNEGNLKYGPFAKAHGAIGSDKKGFAIFSSEAAGHEAKKALLFNSDSYKNLSLKQAIEKYAPRKDGNNTDLYYQNVLGAVGRDTTMSNYNKEEQEIIMNVMRKQEGVKAGTITGNAPMAAGSSIMNSSVNSIPTNNNPTTSYVGFSSFTGSANNFADMPINSNTVSDTPTNMSSGNKSNTAAVTNNNVMMMPNGNIFGPILETLSKQSGAQTTSIVTGLTSLEALLGQILKAINNNKDEAMRLAASGAR